MILTIAPGGAGFTFLSWTIVFLRGDTVYKLLDGTSTKVDINPLKDQIAHKFLKDHIQSSDKLSNLQLGTADSVVYVVPTHQRDFDDIAQYNCKKIVFDCQECHKELFARMLNSVADTRLLNFLNDLSSKFGMDESKQVLLEYSKVFTNYYIVPKKDDKIFVITYNDMFYNLDSCINDVFLFLNIKIDTQRLPLWTKIYYQYREKNKDNLKEFVPAKNIVVSNKLKNQIARELFKWKNGLYHHK
jgi:hypothetical protein